jgi:hypothetical protein
MSESKKPFIVNDRRKFTAEGELRPDAPPARPREEESKPEAAATAAPAQTAEVPAESPLIEDPSLPPPPTAEQSTEANKAYQDTIERLDTAVRAANPGHGPMPELSLERFLQSLYMNALLQMGAVAPEGQQPRVDLLGARQTIDLIALLAEKTKGNLTPEEERFVSTALFELRMTFLEVTQALAQQAAAKAGAAGMPTMGGMPGKPGPTILS